MESTLPPTTAGHHDRGRHVVIGAYPYVAYAIHAVPTLARVKR
jgi:hypothetical protein